MLPEDMQQLGELTQTITVVFLLTIAVLTLWRKWSDERKAREDDARRYEQQIDVLRNGFDRHCQEMVNEYLDDMRHLAGMKEAAWGIKRVPPPNDERRLPAFPVEAGG